MTDENMFCFQCEQTAGCTACTGAAGVCGKTADVARLQDDLTGTLVALARAESGGKGDTESDGLMLEGMFACVSNVSFDPKAIPLLSVAFVRRLFPWANLARTTWACCGTRRRISAA